MDKGGNNDRTTNREGEEKLAIMRKIKDNNAGVEIRRKYSVYPSMYYTCKESYNTFRFESLKPHHRMEAKATKQKKEKVKKLLAEKGSGDCPVQ
ncbi:MAG: hypothetical protein B2I17_05875 [Thermoplasmatales archaeon B_DKE]|nr:MAG: hypothetical protein B2I17_05875 [Thermoplasmatales archaeon B_DKE]